MDEIRALEIRIAKALGYKVVKGTLYSPELNGTLIGGNYLVHVGAISETPEIIKETWMLYTPRFASHMGNAEYLLDFIYEHYGLDYNLFRDNGDWHTCEIGHWSHESDERDNVWAACEKTKALAVVKAVEKCEIVMPRL